MLLRWFSCSRSGEKLYAHGMLVHRSHFHSEWKVEEESFRHQFSPLLDLVEASTCPLMQENSRLVRRPWLRSRSRKMNLSFSLAKTSCLSEEDAGKREGILEVESLGAQLYWGCWSP